MWLIPSALAKAPGSYVGAFVESRDDAPTDAQLLVEGNAPTDAWVISGPDAGAALHIVRLVKEWPPLLAVRPPADGWEAGQLYIIGAVDARMSTPEVAELAFGVRDTPAADPIAPEVIAITAGRWTSDFPRGSLREVTVEVENLDDDPWSVVVLYAAPREPSFERSRGAAIGAGAHRLWTVQERRGGDLSPPCFTVVGLAADGDASDEVPVCVDAGALASCGCAASPTGSAWVAVAAALAALGVRRR